MFSLIKSDVLNNESIFGIKLIIEILIFEDLKSTGYGITLKPCFSNKYFDLFM